MPHGALNGTINREKDAGRVCFPVQEWMLHIELSRRLARYYLEIALFPVAPLRTKRDRFRITSLSSGQSCRPKAASDTQRHSGSPHFAYRMAALV